MRLVSSVTLALALSGALLPEPSSAAGKPIWLDVDPAVMRGGHEPDDGLAMLQAFHSDEVAVRGVSVVFGNSPLETGYPIGREIAKRYGPDGLRVYRGAASSTELGRETEATRALAEALRTELASQIVEIVAVAGRRPGQTFVLGKGGRPLMDMNFEYDPEGFQILLDSGVPLALAPFEISSKVPLPEEDIERFASVPEIAAFFLEPLRDYVNWYDERFGIRAIFPFDTLAVAYVTTPEWIACEELPIEIQTLPDDVQEGRDKPYLLVSKELDSARHATYCHTAAEPFEDDLVRRLLFGKLARADGRLLFLLGGDGPFARLHGDGANELSVSDDGDHTGASVGLVDGGLPFLLATGSLFLSHKNPTILLKSAQVVREVNHGFEPNRKAQNRAVPLCSVAPTRPPRGHGLHLDAALW
jgi:inosine-uridine nucleoside N-ribohydrolase